MTDEQKNIIEINSIIAKLTQTKQNAQFKFTEEQIKCVCHAAKKIFLQQPILLQLAAPINIVGDIHGQFQDLLKIFQLGGFPPQSNYLFLGDYVDRGKMSIQTMLLLLSYKIKYPQNFFMLRGNHESAEINKLYGFYEECKRKYSIKIWKVFTDLFNTMPLCALIQDKILCMHGGISPELSKINKILKYNRPTQIPSQGLLCDLLWSDPDENMKGFKQNSQRGIGYIFGSDVLKQFMKINNLDLICRSHQIVQEGYQFFSKKQLVTVFSAPNYCGQFENNGAILKVDQNLICSFQIIKVQQKTTRDKKNIKSLKYVN